MHAPNDGLLIRPHIGVLLGIRDIQEQNEGDIGYLGEN